ncbi:MAG TPA: hypothetical protein VFN55_00290 [Solirubrobacteraceae bacterium]|nr:hypothetical protein [Solirubrobacteraceae bacterium]
MGELIELQPRRAAHAVAAARPPRTLFVDVGCPLSYLAAEHAERSFGRVDWIPVSGLAVHGELSRSQRARLRRRAEAQAEQLRLPLVWPDHIGAEHRHALRAATFAAEIGAGARFALAAGRLAFCGGFDLDDPETLAEAAAAAAVPLGTCLQAAADTRWDVRLDAAAELLRERQVTELPVLREGERWFAGHAGWPVAAALNGRGQSADGAPARVQGAASASSATVLAYPGGTPLAPAG